MRIAQLTQNTNTSENEKQTQTAIYRNKVYCVPIVLPPISVKFS